MLSQRGQLNVTLMGGGDALRSPTVHLYEVPAASPLLCYSLCWEGPFTSQSVSPTWAQGHVAIVHASLELPERVRGPALPLSILEAPCHCHLPGPAPQWNRSCPQGAAVSDALAQAVVGAGRAQIPW